MTTQLINLTQPLILEPEDLREWNSGKTWVNIKGFNTQLLPLTLSKSHNRTSFLFQILNPNITFQAQLLGFREELQSTAFLLTMSSRQTESYTKVNNLM